MYEESIFYKLSEEGKLQFKYIMQTSHKFELLYGCTAKRGFQVWGGGGGRGALFGWGGGPSIIITERDPVAGGGGIRQGV